MNHSNKIDGRPSMQWYPDDWLSAADVRLCSSAARGLWIDMLCIMFQANPRGTLVANGKQILARGLAKLTGNEIADVERWLAELADAGVFSTSDDGTIYCRRMRRKWHISSVRSAAGRRGGQAKSAGKKVAKQAAPSPTPSPTPTSNTQTVPVSVHVSAPVSSTTAPALHDHTVAFCNHWSMAKGKPVGPKFMQHVNPAFTAGVPFKFAVDVCVKWHGTMAPWDIAKRLTTEWKEKRRFDRGRKEAEAKYCKPDPAVEKMIAELAGKLSTKGE